MDFKGYTKKAKRTDLDDYSEANKRLDINIKNYLRKCFDEIAVIVDVLDRIKKHIFYNKEFYLKQIPTKQYAELSNSDIRILHSIIGIVTEAAELGEIAIKLLTTGKIDYVNLIEEIGDCAWYSALGADECNKVLHADLDVLNINIEKLKKRYPDKFTEKHAVDRDATKERETLEEHINA